MSKISFNKLPDTINFDVSLEFTIDEERRRDLSILGDQVLLGEGSYYFTSVLNGDMIDVYILVPPEKLGLNSYTLETFLTSYDSNGDSNNI